jgi:hypothetical protein
MEIVSYKKDHHFKNAADWLFGLIEEIVLSPISLIRHIRDYLNYYLAALVFYVLPMVVNIYLFQNRERWPIETDKDLFAIGVLTTVPIVNWVPVGITVFEILGRLIAL